MMNENDIFKGQRQREISQQVAFIKFLVNLFRKTKVQYHNGLFFQSAAGVES